MSIHERHAEFSRKIQTVGASAQERARIAVNAKDHFKQQAEHQSPFSEAAVYFQFWSTVARRLVYAAGRAA